jgi:hypothetical protein
MTASVVSDLSQKLMIEPGRTVAVLRPPPGGCPGDIVPTGGEPPYDVVVVFAADEAALDDCGGSGVATVAEDGVLWVAYPNDLDSGEVVSRMQPTGWERAGEAQLGGDWTAVRFTPPS